MTETSEDQVGTAPAVPDRVARPGGASPLAIFAALLTVLLASTLSSVLLLSGAGRLVSNEPAPTAAPVVAPGSTAEPEEAVSSGRVRVVSAGGTSTTTGAGAHQVTFTWTLEGARENDPVEIHFYSGNQLAGQETGTLDASVFSFASGRLTIVTEQACSPTGWSADLVTIRGVLVDGDGLAIVPGVQCR